MMNRIKISSFEVLINLLTKLNNKLQVLCQNKVHGKEPNK